MENTIATIKLIRQSILNEMEGLTLAQLQTIPEKLSNNIFWNAGHCLVTEKLLIYGLSGNEISLPEEWIEKYKKGTAPKFVVTDEEVTFFKENFLKSVDELAFDYESGKLDDFKTYETSLGFVINSVEDALYFNSLHENMHLGAIKILKKLV